ncbi:Outer membrane protein beta-barrel domain-containing protein [Mucilaginibacter pineti]|uniref:Outer membrane protein beta-barrel domain-containing protein n=1 Tax=Mucilaginibacter pineti TaxID=1391627 RepID=A0A1G6TVL0_9SPHI|nr:outer membrane beta-barrel protein [Mucilaginibacter pineti]SDD32345.1 Outer membrane protein beta-barrel domain-containing protein [Mucilaginibacter pineti]
MKNSLNYLDLWQKKRNELPVTDEPKQDWLAMQALLNVHLPSPVVKPSIGSKVIKVVKGLKTGSIITASLSAAAFIGVLAYIYVAKIKPHHPQNNNSKKHGVVVDKDSLLNTLKADSLNLADSVKYEDSLSVKKDSLSQTTPPDNVSGADSAANTDAKDAVNKNTSANNKLNGSAGGGNNGNNPSAGISNGRNLPGNLLGGNGRTGNKPGKNNALLTGGHNAGPKNSSGTDQDSKVNNSNPLNQTAVMGANSYLSQRLIWNADSLQNDLNNFLQPQSNQATPNYIGSFGQSAAIANKIGMGLNKPINKPSDVIQKVKKEKAPKVTKPSKNKTGSSSLSNIDFGIMAGVNASNSFTQKAQNSNFYGSFPVDLYLGLFGTYNFNSKFAVNVQVKGLNPLKLSGAYTHANASKTDTGLVDSGETLRIKDSRKAYFINVPVHFVYKINKYVGVKAGPVINIPVKQVNGNAVLQPVKIMTDTPYFKNINKQLSATQYQQKINFGLSGGVTLQYQRFLLEATYNKSFSSYRVVSDLGSYSQNPGSVQISIGFQLNKPKK